MKHNWDESKSYRLDLKTVFQRLRFCKNCGAFQIWTQDHEWMRVVRSYWFPKVGRCGPKAKEISIKQFKRCGMSIIWTKDGK